MVAVVTVVAAVRIAGCARDGCARHERCDQQGAYRHRGRQRPEHRRGRAPAKGVSIVEQLGQALADASSAELGHNGGWPRVCNGRLTDHARQCQSIMSPSKSPRVGIALEMECELPYRRVAPGYGAAEGLAAHGDQHHEAMPARDVRLLMVEGGV